MRPIKSSYAINVKTLGVAYSIVVNVDHQDFAESKTERIKRDFLLERALHRHR